MTTHDHQDDGEDRKTVKKGYFPLAPGLLHDARLSGLTWRQRYVFITLLANAWRGTDRNGRLSHGQVIKPLPEIAAALNIRIDHLRTDISRMVAAGLVGSEGERVVVAGYDQWHAWARRPDHAVVDSQNGNPVAQDRVGDSQNGDTGSQNGEPVPQNGVPGSQIRAEDSQNGVAEVPSAPGPHRFANSVRRCSDVGSDDSSYVSSSDVPVSAVAATVTADDDDGVEHDSNDNDDGNGGPPDDGRTSSSPSDPASTAERSEGGHRGHPAASPTSVNDPTGDEQVEDLLTQAGLNPAQARRYCKTITPGEASDMINVFTRYYVDRGLPEKVVPCVVSALSHGRQHVQDVIRGGNANLGYRLVEPGAGSTAGEPRRSETAEGIEYSREDNRRRRQTLGELADRL